MTISKAIIAVIVVVSAICGAAITAAVITARTETACAPVPDRAETFHHVPPTRGGAKGY